MILFLWVRPLRHMTQRLSNDCGITTAAIVANVPYEVAAKKSPVQPGKRGLYPGEILRLLKSATGESWRTAKFGWFRPVSRFAKSDELVVLLIRQPWRLWRGHYIAIRGDRVYDPACRTPRFIEQYERRNWLVECMFRCGRQTKVEWMLDRLILLGCVSMAFFGTCVFGVIAFCGTMICCAFVARIMSL